LKLLIDTNLPIPKRLMTWVRERERKKKREKKRVWVEALSSFLPSPLFICFFFFFTFQFESRYLLIYFNTLSRIFNCNYIPYRMTFAWCMHNSLMYFFYIIFFEEIKMKYINNGEGRSLVQGVLETPTRQTNCQSV